MMRLVWGDWVADINRATGGNSFANHHSVKSDLLRMARHSRASMARETFARVLDHQWCSSAISPGWKWSHGARIRRRQWPTRIFAHLWLWVKSMSPLPLGRS